MTRAVCSWPTRPMPQRQEPVASQLSPKPRMRRLKRMRPRQARGRTLRNPESKRTMPEAAQAMRPERTVRRAPTESAMRRSPRKVQRLATPSSVATATSRRAWPRPIAEGTNSARRRRVRAGVHSIRRGRGAASDAAKPCSSRFVRTGSRTVGACPPRGIVTIEPPVHRASATPIS